MAAAANADWEKTPGFGVVLTDEPGADSWPLAGATFILMHKVAQDAAASREALKFFDWAYAKGGKLAEELDYVPMPDKVVAAIKRAWSSEIKDKDGKPICLPIELTIGERRRWPFPYPFIEKHTCEAPRRG
jgi:phosphate transport system substrate-binding protein